MTVVVVGGGFAGLGAATALCERGVPVVVLEARPALGGRASAYVDPATGESVDNGQHIVLGCYHETFRFLARIGAAANVRLQETLTVHVIDREGRPSSLACPPWPAPWHLLGGALRWSALGWRDRAALLRLRPVMRATGGGSGEATGVTVREWLLALGQTPRLIELLWEPLALAALNEPIDVASAGPFREVLRRMFTGHPRDACLGLPAVPLDALYAGPARAFIERHGGTVRTGARARVSLGPEHGTRPVVRLPDGDLRPDAIVCAVAWHALPDLFPVPPPALQGILDAARSTPASPIVTVNLWLDRPVAPQAFVGLPGRPMQWAFDRRALVGGGGSHLSLVSSGAAPIVARSNAELTRLALAEVREAFPEARGATLQRATVVRERRATFSIAPGVPGRPGTRTPVPGLFLAGDWIDTGLPATIESAVVSGHLAADAVMQDR